jgi:thiol-disulfide isomerase/thioredoxin
MKKSVQFCLLITFLLFVIISCSSSEKKCIIKGKTIGVENKTITLFKAGDDIRYGGIEIPIINNTFEHEITYRHVERYQLALNRANMPDGVPTFFTEPGEIYLTVYPDSELDKNEVIGGKLNKEYHVLFNNLLEKKPLFDSLEKIINIQTAINDSLKILEDKVQIVPNKIEQEKIQSKIKNLTNSKIALSQKEKSLYELNQSINQGYLKRQIEYINNHSSILSYYLLYEVLNRHKDEIDVSFAKKKYAVLSKRFPDHPYTELIGNTLQSINNIHVGGQYIDFSAPDINGEIIKVSELTDGKTAVIDLWSTWCSPCILLSRSMIPVFEEFKDHDFVIVGIAGSQNQKDIINLIDKEKYPWITLFEVNNQNKVWEKYGIQNWGGATYLIDKDGRILAISPTAEEIRNFLQKKLK